MTPAIEFDHVVFSTPEGRRLIDNISLTIEPGSVTAILGRSGSGKTTLMRTANRMLDATSGQVRILGQDVRSADLIALRRSIGYVIQETGLFPHFNIERNVGLVLEIQNQPRPQRLERSHQLLADVGLDPKTFATRHPHQLSGGQRQRVGLARALAADPHILLMDEPFGALDPLTRAEMQDMLKALLDRMQKTVLLVTHDLDEALYLADRIVLMDQGHLIANLTPDQFLQSTDPAIETYIHAFHRGTENARDRNAQNAQNARQSTPAATS